MIGVNAMPARMKNEEVLVIGNKPYQKLALDKLIDSFCNNVRCNFSLPGLNNGSLFDELALCNHMYDNLVVNDRGIEKIMDAYDGVFDIEYTKKYFHKYKENLSKYNRVYHAQFDTPRQNSFLRSMGCPYYFEGSFVARTGLTVIIENLLKDNKVFVTNFSIKKEIRYSHYIQKSHSEKEFKSEENKRQGRPELVPCCHKTDSEIKMLSWLHQSKTIDATLCMLNDETEPILECKGMKPSAIIIDRLNKENGKIKI